MTLRPSALRIFAALVLLGLPAGPARTQPIQFSAMELPAVVTRLGDFDFLQPLGLDSRGRVAGTAWLWDEENPFFFGHTAAFRFDPKSNISVALDPLKGLQSWAIAMNDRGAVLGYSMSRNFKRQELFLQSGRGGFDFLREGSKKWIRDGFLVSTLTNRGDIAGVAGTRTGRAAHLLYLGNRGWINLSEGDGQFPELVDKLLLNDDRDYALKNYEGIFGAFGGAKLVRIGPFGFDYSLEALGDGGVVVGNYWRPGSKASREGPPKPFLFTLKGGLVELLPPRLKKGWARWMSPDGVVGGTATRRRAVDTVFTYDNENGFESTSLREKLREFDSETEFRTATVLDMNNSGQFIGAMKVRPARPGRCITGLRGMLYFFLDRQRGLVDLRQVIHDAGLDREINTVVDLNDRGQILVHVCRPDDTWSAVLLTPQ